MNNEVTDFIDLSDILTPIDVELLPSLDGEKISIRSYREPVGQKIESLITNTSQIYGLSITRIRNTLLILEGLPPDRQDAIAERISKGLEERGFKCNLKEKFTTQASAPGKLPSQPSM